MIDRILEVLILIWAFPVVAFAVVCGKPVSVIVNDHTKWFGYPFQPIELDKNGVVRFRQNDIVRFISDRGNVTLNDLAMLPFSDEDREQFYQLIGYSVSGYGDLDFVRREVVAQADRIAEGVIK